MGYGVGRVVTGDFIEVKNDCEKTGAFNICELLDLHVRVAIMKRSRCGDTAEAKKRVGHEDEERVGPEDEKRVGHEEEERVGPEDEKRVGHEDEKQGVSGSTLMEIVLLNLGEFIKFPDCWIVEKIALEFELNFKHMCDIELDDVLDLDALGRLEYDDILEICRLLSRKEPADGFSQAEKIVMKLEDESCRTLDIGKKLLHLLYHTLPVKKEVYWSESSGIGKSFRMTNRVQCLLAFVEAEDVDMIRWWLGSDWEEYEKSDLNGSVKRCQWVLYACFTLNKKEFLCILANQVVFHGQCIDIILFPCASALRMLRSSSPQWNDNAIVSQPDWIKQRRHMIREWCTMFHTNEHFVIGQHQIENVLKYGTIEAMKYFANDQPWLIDFAKLEPRLLWKALGEARNRNPKVYNYAEAKLVEAFGGYSNIPRG